MDATNSEDYESHVFDLGLSQEAGNKEETIDSTRLMEGTQFNKSMVLATGRVDSQQFYAPSDSLTSNTNDGNQNFGVGSMFQWDVDSANTTTNNIANNFIEPSPISPGLFYPNIAFDFNPDLFDSEHMVNLYPDADDAMPKSASAAGASRMGAADEAARTHTVNEVTIENLPQVAPETAPRKMTPKDLPTLRDHTDLTINQLEIPLDECIPFETDEFGEKKVMPNGALLGNRKYRCRTFLVLNRGDQLFMLATECARVLGYRDSYLLFNKNRSLYKIIASQAEKDDLVQQEIIPFSYRSRQITIVTARSIFRQFGSRVIENGRRVRDEYWETKARKQGFTKADTADETDLAEEKRPGGASFLNYGADAEHVETFASATDSGYASLPIHEYKGNVQKIERNGNQQFHSNASDINYTNLLDNENQCLDDASSIYTTGPNIPPSKKDAYISSLADDLRNKVSTEKLDEKSVDRICKALPRHLKTFAMRVGSSGSALICRDVMVFVRRYRSEIAIAMRNSYIRENTVRADGLEYNTAMMDLGDLISNWDLNTNLLQDPNNALNKKPDDVMDDSHYHNLDEADGATDSLPELSAYRDFISKHPAYEWLLQSIQRELYMDVSGNVQTNIRETILGYLPKAHRVGRREAPKRYILTFTVDWDLALFLREQEYRESPERAVERAITITGSKFDAQAATTLQYLSQTWSSYGVCLLRIVKHVVCDTHNMAISYNLPDGTQLKSWPRGPEFKLEVTGAAESIAEIGEQLAWLGSALRPSPHESGAAVVGAFVSGMGINSAEEPAPTYFCNINFEFDMIDDAGEISNGQCWHQLFRNPVIVKGYPIPRRPMSDIGLEISLDTMANLVGTRHINTFHNKIFIKGFSAMLIPTRCSDNILLWHSFCKKNGDRVSYLDGRDLHAEDISLHRLETSRHILGWSSSVKYLVGSADANYNISSSWFRRPDENCKLDGVSISKG
ncbi:uncharacterized protein TrAFT101_005797 [Trichoderma asperellum]|uniref:uncharacterized protein n=1 Tax=Trichoderma asperellum TaxID=101201 RepID=UPI00332C705D|nr:hypothetical protein TrAFT101_005797 [Trichoderma asperellum]